MIPPFLNPYLIKLSKPFTILIESPIKNPNLPQFTTSSHFLPPNDIHKEKKVAKVTPSHLELGSYGFIAIWKNFSQGNFIGFTFVNSVSQISPIRLHLYIRIADYVDRDVDNFI